MSHTRERRRATWTGGFRARGYAASACAQTYACSQAQKCKFYFVWTHYCFCCPEILEFLEVNFSLKTTPKAPPRAKRSYKIILHNQILDTTGTVERIELKLLICWTTATLFDQSLITKFTSSLKSAWIESVRIQHDASRTLIRQSPVQNILLYGAGLASVLWAGVDVAKIRSPPPSPDVWAYGFPNTSLNTWILILFSGGEDDWIIDVLRISKA